MVAMVILVVLGTVAVVIELGLVRLSRERMQDAVEATALEILRERDFGTTPAELSEPAIRDFQRRQRNKQYFSLPFAENLGAGMTPEDSAFGAVNLEVTLGQGEVPLYNRIETEPDRSVPELELNYEPGPLPVARNELHGDIVSGGFSGHSPGGILGADGNPSHVQGADYGRVDFSAAAPSDAPFASAVLVRARRTQPHGYDPLSPLDSQDHISSTGWTLPITFGAGSPFKGEDPEAGYSLRHHGLPLHATAIAAASPALRVGAPHPEWGPEWAVGVAPFGVISFLWDGLLAPWVPDPADPDFEFVTVKIQDFGGVGGAPLELVDINNDSQRLGLPILRIEHRVGDRIIPYTTSAIDYLSPDFWDEEDGFAPLLYFKHVPGQGFQWYVAGFVRVSSEYLGIFSDEGTGDEYGQVKLTRRKPPQAPEQPFIAPRNASAVFDGQHAWDLPEDLWAEILATLKTTPNLVQAPILVR